MQKNPCILPILLLLVLNASSHLSAAPFEVLFPVDNNGEKSVLVSNDGSAILSTHAGAGQYDAHLWKQSQGIVATYPPYGGPIPYGMSGDGQTILTNVYPDPLFFYDASYNGSVRVGALSAYPSGQAVAIVNGQLRDLGKLDPTDTFASASSVSADGKTIVGLSTGPTGRAAFRWTTETGLVSLGTLRGATKKISYALGISSAGDVIVGISASQNSFEEAFRWTADTGMQPLGDLPGGFFASDAYAASDGGNLVVGESYSNSGYEAFIWDGPHGMRRLADVLTSDFNLDLQGFRLRSATDISASGQVIVGLATDAANKAYAFRVNLVPEPSTLMSLIVAISVLALIRQRRPAPSTLLALDSWL